MTFYIIQSMLAQPQVKIKKIENSPNPTRYIRVTKAFGYIEQ